MVKLLLFLTCVWYGNVGRTQVSFNAGPHLTFASLKEGVSGAGGSGELLKKISIDGSARLYAAFTRIPDPDDLKNKVDFIPLRIGYQHTLLKRFVVFGDAGAALFYFPDSRFTSFSFGAGGGYQLQFSDDYLQVTVLYNYANNDVNSYYDWFDLRLSYGFSFKVKPKQVAPQ